MAFPIKFLKKWKIYQILGLGFLIQLDKIFIFRLKIVYSYYFPVYLIYQRITYDLISDELTKTELNYHLTMNDVKRLEMYCRNLVDYHLIVDLIPTLAKLYFLQRVGDVKLSAAQSVSWVTIFDSITL